MATRTIVTSQPDVACDVCERRLLRGEQPEFFRAAGERRTVCELCAPRAAHEGWSRESDQQAIDQPQVRARRARGLFGRLRQSARTARAAPTARVSPHAEEPSQPEKEGSPYDFLDATNPAESPAVAVPARGQSLPVRARVSSGRPQRDAAAGDATEPLRRAIEAFNAGDYPRRVASLQRSLGAPGVRVRADPHLTSVVGIVVAWELCWYRYEVELNGEAPSVSIAAQGTDVEELPPEDLIANALLDEQGMLSLDGAPV